VDDPEPEDRDLFVFLFRHQKPSFRAWSAGYRAFFAKSVAHCSVGSLKTKKHSRLNGTTDRYSGCFDELIKNDQKIHADTK
jgi:hypothetical protein